MGVSDDILQAIETIVDKKIEKMNLDLTYSGIISAVNSDGYTVEYNGTNVNVKTTATDLYKVGDMVKVCIPSGNKRRAYIVVDVEDISEVNTKLAGKSDTSHSHAWSSITGKPTSFTPSSHTHDDRYYTETEINNKINDLNGKINLRGSYTTATGVYTSATWANGSNTCIWKAPATGVYIIFMHYSLTSGSDNEYRQYQIQGTATRLLDYVLAYQPNGTSSLVTGTFCTLVKANSGQTVTPYVHQPTSGQKYNVKIVGVRIS